MAGPNMNYLLVIFLLGVTLHVSAISASEVPTNVKECERRFNERCGIELYNGIVSNEFLTDNCCIDLIKLGKPCHHIFLNWSVASNPNANRSQVLAKGKRIWNECVAIDNSDKHKTKPIKECLENFSATCGEEIEKNIYEGTVVSDACCRYLVSWGKSCHDIIAERNHDVCHPDDNKAQALATSKQVWNKCVGVSR